MIRIPHSLVLVSLVSSAALAAPPSPAPAHGGTERTYLIPHVLERAGAADAMPPAIDTTIIVTDGRALPPDPSARKSGDMDTLKLYLYGDDGKPVVSASGAEVCNPCSFDLDPSGQRRHDIWIEELVMRAGGFPVSPIGTPADVQGFAVAVIDGTDADAIVIDPVIAQSNDTPLASRGACCRDGHVTLIK